VSLPNGISLSPTALVGCMSVTDTHTHIQIDRPPVVTSVTICGITDALTDAT